ncbi:MAG: magnesium and cobalt exporter, family [Solirubrobacterales bacterium]|jgi:CBS domain containing-hemolysin-like protein|nr:magnesium and cobalt exporter, family [Solirubrobacterales bacterium]
MSVVLLVLLLVLIAINGFFVAAEFAIVRSRRSRLEQLRDEGVNRARIAIDQIDHVDQYVATCQVGITLASLGIGFLGEPALAKLFEPLFGNVLAHTAAVAISIALAFTIVTFLHVILGEQAPKMLAIARAENVLLRVAGPLKFFRTALHPLIIATNVPANWLVRVVFRVDPDSIAEETSPEELRLLISRGAQRGRLDPGEAGHLAGVFHLHEQEAREVMTPIPAVVTVDAAETVEAALRRCVTSGHTRLVVIEDDNPDRVRGIVHNNSLARLYMSDGPDASIEPLIREALIVPETRPLDDLLHDLQVQRTSLAVVVDEYGRTVGIVTVEDILEEVVGEIEDETDPRAAALRQLSNGDWFVRGHVSLGDLADAGIELPVDTDAYNSIGGYVFGELGRLPKRGDSITVNGYTIRVEAVRENRIEAVRISGSVRHDT